MDIQMMIFLFAASFLIGLVLAFSTQFYNKEGFKKSFRTGAFRGSGKTLDSKISEEVKKDNKEKKIFFHDDMDYHASKKYK